MSTPAADTGPAPEELRWPRTDIGRAARQWLAPALGMVGLTVALLTALGPLRVEPERSAEGIAVVDGRAIPRATFDRAIAALEADKRNPVTDADRRVALSRLIDEELLTRRALDLGLAENEPTVRKALVDALIQLASVSEARPDPDDQELRRFYEGRPTLFAGESLSSVAVADFPATDTARSERMASLLRAGVAFDKAAAETGALPAAATLDLLSARKLTDYAGPTIAAAVRRLAAGEAAGPIAVGDRFVFVRVVARQDAPRPRFEDVREQTLDAWRRDARDRALESYLAGLRSRANITFAGDAPR